MFGPSRCVEFGRIISVCHARCSLPSIAAPGRHSGAKTGRVGFLRIGTGEIGKQESHEWPMQKILVLLTGNDGTASTTGQLAALRNGLKESPNFGDDWVHISTPAPMSNDGKFSVVTP